MTGPIPEELGDLSQLRELYLYQNRLTGQIPPRLTQLDNLTALWLAFNRFTGCLPPALRDVRSNDLADLTLDDCGPLALTLTAERAQCTAGTRTPVTWEITGSAPPYTLSVAGETVDADAESVTVTCGTLPEPAEGEDPVTQAPGTITASVTDTAGATATASADYTIVPPLLAPVATADPWVTRFFVLIEWDGLTVPASCDVATGCFAFRVRLAGETSWAYSWDEHENAQSEWTPGIYRSVPAGTTVEAGIAAMRHPIEIETPEALNWAATAQATSLTDISGLTATATHDTITVRWNRQTSADTWRLSISGAGVRGGQSKSIRDFKADWGDPTSATHEVTFTDLPPDTEYQVTVSGPDGPEDEPAATVRATTTVRTAVAPTDHTPLVRGPQNLRATTTHDSITVQWEHPRPDVEDEYRLYIEGPYGGRFAHVPVWPPNSQYTFDRLLPGTSYLVRVIHDDITRTSAEITITTRAAPPAGAAGETGAQAAQRSAQPWPLTTPFAPVWPVPAYSSSSTDDPERWAWVTDDAWILRTIGRARWHAAIDIGVNDRRTSDGDHDYRLPIQAIANGVVREFTLGAYDYLVYCPGASGVGGDMIDDVYKQRLVNDARDGYTCTEIANDAHGRVALTLHEYSDGTLYVVSYVHLSKVGSGDAADTAGDENAQPVVAGQTIGVEGGSGWECTEYNDADQCVTRVFDENLYDPHLHLTIRVFTREGAVGEVEDAEGATWRYRSEAGNFNCANSDYAALGYCKAPRSIDTMVDPEIVFAPAPPATTYESPQAGAPTWVGPPNHVSSSSYVNNEHKRFVLTGIDQAGSGGAVEAQLDIAAGRPRYYLWSRVATARRVPGVAGTADGVLGYFADARGCAHGVADSVWNERTRSSAIGFTGHATPRYWSEVEPLTLGIPILRGETCVTTVRSYNATYRPWDAVPDNAYGKGSDGENVRPPLPTAAIELAEALEAGTGTRTGTLAHSDHDIYPFQAVTGSTYAFCAEQDPQGRCRDEARDTGVVFELWQGSNKLVQSDQSNFRWDATGSGTYFLVVRNDYPTGAALPSTGPYTLYYDVPCVPSFAIESLSYEFLVGIAVNQTLPAATGCGDPLGYGLFLLEMMGHGGASGSQGTMAQLPAGLSFNAANRKITGTPTTVTAAQTYTLRATDEADPDQTAELAVTIAVTPTLSALSLSGVTLAPAFASGTLTYTASVARTVSQTTVTATATESTATVAITPADADTNTAGHQVTLAAGETTTITATVTAQDGVTSSAYTVAVARASLPEGTTLSALSLSGVTLAPAFASDTLTYTARVPHTVSQTTVAATPTVSTASVAITPADADTNTTGHQVNLTSGATTTITVTVTAPGGGATSSYTMAVTRAAACPAPARTRTVAGPTETRWTAPSAGKTHEERRTSTQAQERTVTRGAGTCNWILGDWANVGDPVWGAWGSTGISRDAPAKPSATNPNPPRTPTGTTRWTEPAGGKTHEEQEVSVQPQSRTVTWDAADCEWDTGAWVDDGDPYTDWDLTGTSRDAPTKPPTVNPNPPRTPTGTTRWTAPLGGRTSEEREVSVQPQSRTVTWDAANCKWVTGTWEDDGDPYKDWDLTGTSRDAPARPGDPAPTVLQTSYRWEVRGTTPNRVAHHQKNERRQNRTWTVTWDTAECAWDTGDPENDGDPYWSGWSDTSTPPKPEPEPPPNVEQVPVGPPETRWVTDPNIPFCILWEEQRQRYRTTIYGNQSWVWRAPNWVLQRTMLFQGYTYTAWTRTGNTTACPRSTQDNNGAGGQAAAVSLAAGDYTLPWGLQRISFTVPADTEVQLTLRTLESGVQAVVLSSAAGVELVLYPGALADGARPSPSVADTTLSTIAATLALTEVELVAPPPPADEECAVVTAAESGATAVDMDASLCAIVPTGALMVTLGGQTLSLTLPTGYDWLLLRVSPDPAVLGVIDTASGAYLALNAATGAEESREVGEDVAATIGPIFNAIVTSAQPPAAEDDSS